MLNCPRCDKPVSSKAVICPHCQMVLKAYGHPGITLHRATGDIPLCQSCTYEADDTCTFPQRPYAKECTLYDDVSRSKLETQQLYTPRRGLVGAVRLWCQRNPTWLGLLGVLAVSFLLALMTASK